MTPPDNTQNAQEQPRCPKCQSPRLEVSEFGTFCNDCDWDMERVNVGINGKSHEAL